MASTEDPWSSSTARCDQTSSKPPSKLLKVPQELDSALRDKGLYAFGAFRLDPGRRSLTRDGVPVPLTPKVFDTLLYLVENHGRVVEKDEILNALWPGRIVEESNISQTIFTLRKALGGAGGQAQFIVTVPGRGYRFIAQIAVAVRPDAENILLPFVMDPPRPVWRVGRQAPLETLELAQQRTLSGDRHLVFVTGEAGIGKTTLVGMALERMARRGVNILRGGCTELFGRNEAFLPLIEALEACCRGADGPSLLAALRDHAPTWLAQMPAFLSEKDRTTFQREIFGATRERMLREFCDFVDVISESRPWVIVLDDLHWSDFATVDLLSRFVRRERRASVLVVATYRPVDVMLAGHPVGTVHQDLQIHGFCTELALDRLSPADVREYLAIRFRDPDLAETLAGRVFQRTQGQPLFLVSMIDYWVANGTLREVDGCWRLESDDTISQWGIPRDLRVMITRQIDRLAVGDQDLLEIASAAGKEFSAAIVAGASDRDMLEVERTFDLIARNGHILSVAGAAAWPDGTVSGSYAFQHGLYQDVLYQRLAPGRRVHIHRRIGARLEAAYPARTAEIAPVLALHFVEGRDFAKAVSYLGQAAESAARRFANREALSYLTHALDIVDQATDADPLMLRIKLLQQRGWVRRSAGDFAGSLDDLNRMISCAVEAKQLLLEVSGLVDLSRFCLLFADRRQCLPAAERAPVRSRGLNDEIYTALVAGNTACIKLQLKGWREEDAELCRQAVIATAETSDPRIAIRRDGIESIMKYLRSEYRDCSVAARRVKEVVQETGDVFLFGLYNTIESAALVQLGQWRMLQRGVVAALGVAEKNSNVLAGIMCRLIIALLHVEALDFAEARKRCEEIRNLSFETSPWLYFFHQTVLAKACLGMQDYPAAWGHLGDLIQKTEVDGHDLDSMFSPHFFNTLCEYFLETGALVQAQERAAQFYDFTVRAPDLNYLALAHRVQAEIAFGSGNLAEAQHHLSSAIEIVESADLPLAAWRVYLTASALYGSSGDVDKAALYRRRCEAGIETLAGNLDDDDPLRSRFLAGFAAESGRKLQGREPSIGGS